MYFPELWVLTCFGIATAATTTSTSNSITAQSYSSSPPTCQRSTTPNPFHPTILSQCPRRDDIVDTRRTVYVSTGGDTSPAQTSRTPTIIDDRPIIITPVTTMDNVLPPLIAPIIEPTTAHEVKEDETLDDLAFLSFEEWKRQMEEKPDVESNERKSAGATLESTRIFGDVDVDIHAIIDEQQAMTTHKDPNARAIPDTNARSSSIAVSTDRPRPRSKDAGRTCKERFNFASADAGGQIMKSNAEAKRTSSILNENRDNYMLNTCSAKNKFVIVELSDSIYVETVALANFEFFSSTFRQFRVSVSAKYPVKADRWKTLGTFEAQNAKTIQAFLVESPLIEARYLRIEFLNHYGNEYYCPLSLLRVHGQTMLQEVMSWERAASGEVDDDDIDEPEVADVDRLQSDETVVMSGHGESVVPTISEDSQVEITSTSKQAAPISTSNRPERETLRNHISDRVLSNMLASNMTLWRSSKIELRDMFGLQTCAATGSSTILTLMKAPPRTAATTAATVTETATHRKYDESPATTVSTETNVTSTPQITITEKSISASGNSSVPAHSKMISNSARTAETPSHENKPSNTSVNASRANVRASKVPSSQSAQPSTQESFFKTVTKRLQQLETNATLQHKYMEMQYRSQREATNKFQKREVSKLVSLIENMNTTHLAQLRRVDQEKEQIQAIALAQNEDLRQEMAMLREKVQSQGWWISMLFGLSILSLGLLVVSWGGGGGGTIDMPALQSMLASSRRSRSMIGFGSPGNNIQLRRNDSYREDTPTWDDTPYEPIRSDDSDNMYSMSRELSPALLVSGNSERENERRLDTNRRRSMDDSISLTNQSEYFDGNNDGGDSQADVLHDPNTLRERSPQITPMRSHTPANPLRNGEMSSKKRRKLAAKRALQEARKSLPSPPPDFENGSLEAGNRRA